MEEKGFQRTGSYPIQTAEFTPHSEESTETRDEGYEQRLPISIRALKDSRDENHHPRTIVICLDGTGDRFDSDNSSVVNFVSGLKKHSPGEQVTYYQSGIGTYDKGGLKNGISAGLDMAVGSGLGIHIKDAYKFLMQNYREGDKICLLGFSRGAYTVRCLAGMLHKVGLLPASNVSQVSFAFKFYKDASVAGQHLAAEFKKTFCTHVDVYFLGVWDCVASVGVIPRKLPLSKSPTNSIHYFRHAMALDERRAKFKVCQWQQQDPAISSAIKHSNTIDKTPTGRLSRSGLADWIRDKKQSDATQKNDRKYSDSAMSNENMSEHQEALECKFQAQHEATKRHREFTSDALEVWFMGTHADVGGGAVKNESRHMLSRIPLRWMIRQCFDCNTGILFETSRLAELGIDVQTLWPTYRQPLKPTVGPPPRLIEKYENKTLAPLKRRSVFLPIGPVDNSIEDAPTVEDLQYVLPSESTEDHFDSMEKPIDQLVVAKGWWILEFWPVKMRVLVNDGKAWEKRVRMNMGRYRAIREVEPKIHWTVQHMIDEGKYTLKTRTDRDNCWQEVV